jgi:hypothetical protein
MQRLTLQHEVVESGNGSLSLLVLLVANEAKTLRAAIGEFHHANGRDVSVRLEDLVKLTGINGGLCGFENRTLKVS